MPGLYLPLALKMTPLLSVLMITYNHEAFIGRSIESVLSQKTDFPFELVIGDDHSTDNTKQIAMKYAEKYPDTIKLLSHSSNLGVIPNFQNTLERCKGRYVAILEGDDRWIDESKLQKQVNFMERNPDYVLCGGHTISESSSNKLIYNLISRFKYLRKGSLKLQTFELDEVIIANHFKTLTVVFRSEFLRQPWNPAFRASTILDWLIYISLGLNNDKKARYANLPDILAAYNVHSGGIFSGTSMARRLQIFADVRNCIGVATENKYFGFHYPVMILNEEQQKNQPKITYLQELNKQYKDRVNIGFYCENKNELLKVISEIIDEVNIETLGYIFSLLYIYSANFDEFSLSIAKLMDSLDQLIPDKQRKEKKMRALACAWRACMFYESFSIKTILLFMRSQLSKYADIYVYTLILTLLQKSKR